LQAIALQTLVSAAADAASQQLAKDSGLQDHFDRRAFVNHLSRQVATSIISAGINSAMDINTHQLEGFQERFEASLSNAISDQLTMMLSEHGTHFDERQFFSSLGKQLVNETLSLLGADSAIDALASSADQKIVGATLKSGVHAAAMSGIAKLIDNRRDMGMDFIQDFAVQVFCNTKALYQDAQATQEYLEKQQVTKGALQDAQAQSRTDDHGSDPFMSAQGGGAGGSDLGESDARQEAFEQLRAAHRDRDEMDAHARGESVSSNHELSPFIKAPQNDNHSVESSLDLLLTRNRPGDRYRMFKPSQYRQATESKSLWKNMYDIGQSGVQKYNRFVGNEGFLSNTIAINSIAETAYDLKSNIQGGFTDTMYKLRALSDLPGGSYETIMAKLNGVKVDLASIKVQNTLRYMKDSMQSISFKSAFGFAAAGDVLDYSLNSLFKLDTKRNLSHPKLLAKDVMIDTGKGLVAAPVGVAAGSAAAMIAETTAALFVPELLVPIEFSAYIGSMWYASSKASDIMEKEIFHKYALR
jgi:hypothetical protein